MRRAMLLAVVLMAAVTGAGAQVRPATQAPAVAQVQPVRHGLTIYTDYATHAVTEIVDLDLGRVVSRRRSAPTARAAAASTTSAARCSNSGSYSFGSEGIAHPWRLSEPIRINSSGAPSRMVGDWRNQILEGKRVWEQTRNACGIGDVIVWEAPDYGEASAPAVTNCTTADDENVIGFAGFGGWASDGLVLARTCTWWTGGFIYEADIAFNNHPDVKWANGSYAGYWDLQSVAAHEWGHALGLDHVEESASQASYTAVMHPIVYRQDTRNRSLSRGDVDGARSLYPSLYGFEVVSASLENPAGAGQRLEPNRTYTAVVEVVNRGFKPWSVGATSGDTIMVSTYPSGRCSSYVGADWRSCSEPSVIDADLSDAGGGPENSNMVVAQGESARLSFQIPVTWAREGTFSFEQFRVRGVPVSNPGVFTLPVDVGTVRPVLAGTGGPGLVFPAIVVRGTSNHAAVTVRNDGTAPWILDDSRWTLLTEGPGRCSPYAGTAWRSCREPGGATIPQDDRLVLPGETLTFDFNLVMPLYTDLSAPRKVMEMFDVAIRGRGAERLGLKPTFHFQVY